MRHAMIFDGLLLYGVYFLLHTVTYSSAQTVLPQHLDIFRKSFKGNHFWVDMGENAAFPWEQGKDECRKKNGVLAEFHTNEELQFLTSFVKGANIESQYGAWTGLNDRQNNGLFIFTSGRIAGAIDSDMWSDDGRHENRKYYEHCAAILNNSSTKLDINWCGNRRRVICSSHATREMTFQDKAGLKWKSRSRKYWINTKPRSWNESRLKCQEENGGDIATFSDQEEFQLLTTYVKRSGMTNDIGAWIGLNNMKNNSDFVFLDGSKLVNVTGIWARRQPDNYRGNENCVHFWLDPPKLNDESCSCWSKRASICSSNIDTSNQIYSSVLPKPNFVTRIFNGITYMLDKSKSGLLPWEQAKLQCHKYNAVLAEFHTKKELQFLASFVEDSKSCLQFGAWTGLSDRYTTGKFIFSEDVQPFCVKSISSDMWSDESRTGNRRNFEHCVAFVGGQSKLEVKWCGYNKSVVCSTHTPREKSLEDRSGFNLQIKSTRFWINTMPRSWRDARQKCLQDGGDLAKFTHQAEFDSIVELIKRSELNNDVGVWIGLNDMKLNNDFVFLDESKPVNVTGIWASRQPDNYRGSESCVHFWLDPPKLNDALCRDWSKRASLCSGPNLPISGDQLKLSIT